VRPLRGRPVPRTGPGVLQYRLRPMGRHGLRGLPGDRGPLLRRRRGRRRGGQPQARLCPPRRRGDRGEPRFGVRPAGRVRAQRRRHRVPPQGGGHPAHRLRPPLHPRERDPDRADRLPPEAHSRPEGHAPQLRRVAGGGGLFLSGLSQALTRPADGDEFSSLGALGLRCSDYRDVLSPGADLLGCCLGRVKQGCAEFAPQGAKCDAAIAAYCRGSGADPAGCGCFTSPLAGGGGRPQCYDSRCAPGNAEAASAYRPRSLPIASCASLLKQPLSCDIWEALGRGKHLAKGVTVPPACAGGGADWFHANRGLLLFLLLCLVIGGVAFAVHRSHRRPPIPPPPPAEG